MAPVVTALAARGLAPTLVVTGQHPELDLGAYGLARLPCINLHCPGRPDPNAHAHAVSEAMQPLLARGPELIIVQGDTSSALGGALGGFLGQVPVAHVEAGLRSFDPLLPWPEEDNRVFIDSGAALLFAPTETSAANLRAEGCLGEIHITGNTAIDALRLQLGRLPAPPRRAEPTNPRLLVTCHRRENWGPAFEPIASALLELADLPELRIDVLLHPNPAMANTVRELLGNHPRIGLLKPLDHAGMIAAMRGATLLLSDSGGVQEEAPALGIPLLVLREKTERPEAIASGNMLLVGTDKDSIVREARRILTDFEVHAAMSRPALPYGDGHSADRIAGTIVEWLARKAPSRRRLIA